MEQPVPSENQYKVVRTNQELRELSSELRSASRIGGDTETTGLDVFTKKFLGLSCSPRPGLSYYIPVGHPNNPLEFADVQEFLKQLRVLPWSFHNAKFDWGWINYTFEVDLNLHVDTQVLAHLENTNRSIRQEELGLKALAQSVLGIEATTFEDMVLAAGLTRGYSKAEIHKLVKDHSLRHDLHELLMTLEVDEIAAYAASDADLTGRLVDLWDAPVRKDYAAVLQIEMELIKPISRMEENGIAIDAEKVDLLQNQCQTYLDVIEPKLKRELGGIELDSPRQLERALTGLGVQLTKRTTKGNSFSVDEESLKSVQDDYTIVRDLLERKKIAKLKDSYLSKIGTYINFGTNRIHCSFNQVGVCSGRFSSYDPNMQQQPKKPVKDMLFRTVFVPADGYVLTASDYNQIELRILLGISNSPLVEALRQGKDIHTEIAALVYGKPPSDVTKEERDDCKRVVYGLAYGMDEYSLARKFSMSIERAKAIMNLFFSRLQGVKQSIDSTYEFVQKTGYVSTLFGRRRYFPDVTSRDRRLKNRALRGAYNHIIQGTAADINKIGLIRVEKILNKKWNVTTHPLDRKAKMLLTVHDELVCEISKDLALNEVVSDIERGMSMEIAGAPITVKTKWGMSWGEMTQFGEEVVEEAEDVQIDGVESAVSE